VPGKEALDARQRRHECVGKVRKGCRTDDHQQGDAMPHDGGAFVRLVADAAIMGECDPTALPDLLQPYFVSGVRRKVIGMSLDCQTARPENLGKALTKVAISEIDKRQAARS
jgi:hypothetical protein